MKYYISLFFKGILLGFVSLAIPGLSGSTVALLIGTYFTLVNAISNVFTDFKHSALYLLFQMSGYAVGCAIGAVSVTFLYDKYPLATILVIIGFILGGIPQMAKESKPGFKKPSCWIVVAFIIAFLAFYSFFVTEGENISFDSMSIADYVILFFVGAFVSCTLVIPGIDYAVVLLAIGYYNPILATLSGLFDKSTFLHSGLVLIIFWVGYMLGSVGFSKLIKLLLNKFYIQVQFASLGFVVTAPIIVIKKCMIDNPNYYFTIPQLIIGTILGIAALLALYFFPKPTDKTIETGIEKAKVQDEERINDELIIKEEAFEADNKEIMENINNDKKENDNQ